MRESYAAETWCPAVTSEQVADLTGGWGSVEVGDGGF